MGLRWTHWWPQIKTHWCRSVSNIVSIQPWQISLHNFSPGLSSSHPHLCQEVLPRKFSWVFWEVLYAPPVSWMLRSRDCKTQNPENFLESPSHREQLWSKFCDGLDPGTLVVSEPRFCNIEYLTTLTYYLPWRDRRLIVNSVAVKCRRFCCVWLTLHWFDLLCLCICCTTTYTASPHHHRITWREQTKASKSLCIQKYITKIQLYTTQNNSLQHYGSQCHGDLLGSHIILPG